MDGIRIKTILQQAIRVLLMYPLLFIVVQAITNVDLLMIILSGLDTHWLPERVMAPNTPGGRIVEGTVDIFRGLMAPVSYSIICIVASQAMQGKALHLRDAIQSGLQRYFALLGVLMVVGLRVVLGCLLLIVPGIINAIAAAVATPVCVIENRSPLQSVQRSASLTHSNRSRVLCLFLIPILGGAALIGLEFALGSRVEGPAQAFANLFTRSVVSAYLSVLTVVLYYHLKAHKEGLDVPQLARMAIDPGSGRRAELLK
jgi:hypothetical protein